MTLIGFHEATRTFSLQTLHSTYAFCIHPLHQVPVHLHWGAKITAPETLVPLIDQRYRAGCPDSFPGTGAPSLDIVAQEYPTHGIGDFRPPALSVKQPDGSRVLALEYRSHRIFKGKPTLPSLPATYVESEDEAETLELELVDQKIGLRVLVQYTAFRDFDAVTRSAIIINDGGADLEILGAMSCSIDLPRADMKMLHLSGTWTRERSVELSPLRPGTQGVESRRGASSHVHNPFLALLDPEAGEEAGEVRGFSLVYSGNFVAQAEVDPLYTTRVSVGINTFDFAWKLAPGERFQTPETVLVFSASGLGGMSRTYHKLYRTRLCRGKFRDADRPVLVNNWEATYFSFTEEKLLRLASKAADLGLDLFVLDDGWFGRRHDDTTSLGDWVVDREKLPSGLESLVEKVNATGVQFGLWFEPEMVSPDSDLYRAHPDWCLHVPERKRTVSRFQHVLDLSRSDVCDYIIEAVAAILSSTPISYVKWDMNRSITEAGSAILPPDRQMEVSHRYMLGVYRVMDELTTRFPDVLFEGCASGGGRFDPGMLYYTPQIWTSDNSDAICRIEIQYGTSIVYPMSSISAHVSAVPNHQVHRNTPIETRAQVAMTGAFGYELDLNQLPAEEQQAVKEQVALYKEVRGVISTGDFYRLLSPFERKDAAWMTVSADKSEAVVFYGQILAKAYAPELRLRLRGLDPARTYVINGVLKLGGDLLMNSGLPVPELAGDFRTRLWRLKAE